MATPDPTQIMNASAAAESSVPAPPVTPTVQSGGSAVLSRLLGNTASGSTATVSTPNMLPPVSMVSVQPTASAAGFQPVLSLPASNFAPTTLATASMCNSNGMFVWKGL